MNNTFWGTRIELGIGVGDRNREGSRRPRREGRAGGGVIGNACETWRTENPKVLENLAAMIS